jgi:hypothetical protein
MARFVHTVHRYKRPPKRKEPVALKIGRIARAGNDRATASDQTAEASEPPPDKIRTSRIVTGKRKPGRFGEAEDLTPEEYQHRGDAADALFRELVRRATGKS